MKNYPEAISKIINRCQPEPDSHRAVEGSSVAKSGFGSPIAIGLNHTHVLFLRWLPVLILSTSLLIACSSSPPAAEEIVSNDGDNEILTISQAQYDAAGITLGKVEKRKIKKAIRVNGRLEVPPQNLVTISAPMGGFVKSTSLLQGMKVRKGDALITLQHQDYIQLQQDYLDNLSKLQFLETDYARQQELAQENVNAKKTLQQAKSSYESMRAIVAGLEAKLELLNITPVSLQAGKISSTITLYSPLDGFVTMVNVNIGQYVNSTDVIFKIVNVEHLHVELQVYEQDINKIAIGQPVHLVLANENSERTATVYLIGKEISPERTVQLHCHLAKEDPSLIPGTFVSASIEINSKESYALPSKALVHYEGMDYMFIALGNNQFKATQVTTGTTEEKYTSLVLDSAYNMESSVVVSGAFELIGLLKNKGEE